jgi:hypothetical protein
MVTAVPPRLDPAFGETLVILGVVDGLVVDPPQADARMARAARLPRSDRRDIREITLFQF